MVKFNKETVEYKIEDLVRDQTKNEIKNVQIGLFNPGYRLDNKWHLYDANFLSNSSTKTWSETKFLDKSNVQVWLWIKHWKMVRHAKRFKLN